MMFLSFGRVKSWPWPKPRSQSPPRPNISINAIFAELRDNIGQPIRGVDLEVDIDR